ncbi:MAG: hypothetical protein IPL08_17870 [Saprospiraceae bacterium]|nr:hypothetical protein [Saprospiraceae bacterium]
MRFTSSYADNKVKIIAERISYTFLGTTSSDWATSGNWQAGAIPPNPLAAGDTIFIDANCQLSANYTIGNTGVLVNKSNKTLTNNGTLTINVNGQLHNYGTLNNGTTGTLTNNNDLRNYSGGTLTNNGILTINLKGAPIICVPI